MAMKPSDLRRGHCVTGALSHGEERAVAAAIAIPAHVVQAKGHGHAGTAMAMAPLAHVLYQRILHHDPADPTWPGRDRFVLSAGHASLLLYTQLYLTGYGLELADLAASRSLASRTPGHPELGQTPGVEMSTGPLGQGVASAVGLALAGRRDAALHDVDCGVWDPTVYVLAGDGCLQEGVTAEASSLAGTLGLDNLVLIWDDNGVTIDARTSETFGEDVRARFRAYGWRVLEIEDFRDLTQIETTLRAAARRTGYPTLVAIRSVIGAPSELRGGLPAAHAGGFGDDEVAAVKASLGFAGDATLEELVTPDALAFARAARDRGAELHLAWERRRVAWESEHPGPAARRTALASAMAGSSPGIDEPLAALDTLQLPPEGARAAARVTNGSVLQALQPWGGLWGGSADLAVSTNVDLPGTAVSAEQPDGDFIRFGVREHAMAAVLSGVALHGLWRPFGSTYLVFSDYQRPSIRLAALMSLPVVYVFTHDSVAVGEDGPTHQAVEQIASLRTVPGLAVLRPADAHEVVAIWRRLVQQPKGPVALILSRQGLPVLSRRDDLPEKVAHGGYVVWQHGSGHDLALIATGSEVSLALEAARILARSDTQVRVVSMPCVEWFIASDDAWRESVLPDALRRRVAIEAGRGDAWYRWAGRRGEVVSIEDYGESGPGDVVLERRGITLDAVLAAARTQLGR